MVALQVKASCPGFTGPLGPYSIGEKLIVGDFNHDNKDDLAGFSSVASAIKVALSNGDGTFAAPVSYTSASIPAAGLVADFNGDGKLDIAVAGGANVSVFLGNGDGTFAAAGNYGVTGPANSIAAGDVNGDGKIDLAIAGGSEIDFLIGRGDGTFFFSPTTIAAANACCVSIRDVTNDGKKDVLALIGIFGTRDALAIYPGNGDGTFGPLISRNFVATFQTFTTADFNGDGFVDVDLVTINNVHYFLLGNGDGTFIQSGTDNSEHVGSSVFDFAVVSLDIGDFNLDGRLDIIVGREPHAAGYSNEVYFYLGDGSGHFLKVRDPTGNAGVSYAVSGDFNGDGSSDYATQVNTIHVNTRTAACATVASVSSSAGPVAGGDYVTLNGMGLGGVSAVTFGGVAGTITGKGDTFVDVTTNPHSAGTVAIQITTPSGTDTLDFSYVYVSAPVITSVSPNSGPSAGGQSVTITGTDFNPAYKLTVTFGGVGAASYTTWTDTMITVVTPAHAGGVFDVGVNTVGGSATATQAYTYGPTSTALSTTANPSVWGQMVIFTATITSPYPPAIGGSVTFKDGVTILGSTIVSGATATFRTNILIAGNHSITAVYNGDAHFAPSTSPVLTQGVNAGAWTSFSAVATSTTTADLTWSAGGSPVQYEIYRSSGGAGFMLIATRTPPTTTFTDTNLTPNTTYLYKMRWLDSGANPSEYTPVDAATTITYTDTPLLAGMLPKPAHILEARIAANAIRAAAGLPAATFADPDLASGFVFKAVHINEVRTAISAARDAIGLATLGVTDTPVTAGVTIVKAEHILQLRAGAE